MRAYCSDSLRIMSDRPGEIGYRSGLYVLPLSDSPADIVAASRDSLPGYSVVYRPPADVPHGGRHLAVWKRLPYVTGERQ